MGDLDPDRLGDEDLAAPHLIDSEVTHALRGLVRRTVLTEKQGTLALEGFLELTPIRFPAGRLRMRMWTLRRNLSAYDATYVALAELSGATALLTTDARLARAPGLQCRIELLDERGLLQRVGVDRVAPVVADRQNACGVVDPQL